MENLRERLHVLCSWQSRERPEGSSFGYSLVRILCGKISVFEREFLGVILGEDPMGAFPLTGIPAGFATN
ncbi:putative disease resistance protein RXW24L [Corchorus olitorius]|uniref:Disease resistance protein RXW24L n=1 Tax=Corchorus olitorius TaxID=93759 RepID=A0A1R3IUR5_9ROSI|nr:putative disease resistance protein RXW24L [Corchorus olitorius]